MTERYDAREVFVGARVRSQRGLRGFHVGVFALIAAGALLASVFVAIDLLSSWAWVAGWLVLVGAPTAGALLWEERARTKGGADVSAGPDGLWCDGRLVLRREEMSRAVLLDDASGAPSGAIVSIERKNGYHAVVEVPSAAEGRRLMRALGLDVDQTLGRFMADSPLYGRIPWAVVGAYFLGLPGVALWALAQSSFALGGSVLLLWYVGVLIFGLPTSITVGLDGVLLSFLGRKQLVPLRELSGCAAEGRAVLLYRADGSSIRLSVQGLAGRRRGSRSDPGLPEMASAEGYARVIAGRIEEAIQKSRAGASTVEQVERALRSGAAIADRAKALAAEMARGAAGFRGAPLAEEALFKVALDASERPGARAAAAAALSSSLNDEGRSKLRVAAEVVASPKLRVALEAAAEGDNDDLEAALSELEAEEQQAQRARVLKVPSLGED